MPKERTDFRGCGNYITGEVRTLQRRRSELKKEYREFCSGDLRINKAFYYAAALRDRIEQLSSKIESIHKQIPKGIVYNPRLSKTQV